jgi:hypothetical protein
MKRRPISVTIVSYLLIAVGAIGFVYHLAELKSSRPSEYVWVLGLRLLAVVAGVSMLRGKDWARWLSIAWIAFHVVLSFFHSMGQEAVHAVVLVVFAVVLFQPAANQFFRGRALDRE